MLDDSRFEDWTFYWSFDGNHIDRFRDEPTLERARVVQRGSTAYYDALATSKYWVFNCRVPEYVVPRDDQIYVQCWHGTPLKRLGCDVSSNSSGGALNSADELAARFRMDSEKWAYLLSPSEYTSKHLCDAFGLPEGRRADVVLQEGYPRNDIIRQTLDASDAGERIDAIKERISSWLPDERARQQDHVGDAELDSSLVERLHIPPDRKVLLYAPTFRDDQYTPGVGYSLGLGIDLDALQERLGEEWVVLLRMHYYISNQIDLDKWAGFAFDVSNWPDINELYLVSDALCTDYSSVFFDYSNTGRPIYFLWPDLEHYGKELHGFYLDPLTLPGPKCRNTSELLNALEKDGSWFDDFGADYEKFRASFCPRDDGHAAERVIARVFAE